MNTRLQVEHPVTEMITGQDLVEWQLRIAAGLPLPLSQDQIALRGHAIEARVYAEDPGRGFLPSTGRLDHLRWPQQSASVRIDTGVVEGDEVSPFYDPMLAKVVVHGADRPTALRRLRAALAGSQVVGPATNLDLLARIARDPAFAAGGVDTGFIESARETLLAPASRALRCGLGDRRAVGPVPPARSGGEAGGTQPRALLTLASGRWLAAQRCRAADGAAGPGRAGHECRGDGARGRLPACDRRAPARGSRR